MMSLDGNAWDISVDSDKTDQRLRNKIFDMLEKLEGKKGQYKD